MKRYKDAYSLRLIEEMYRHVPAFNDIFDEETWYMFVVFFVTGTVLLVFILSRYITLKPPTSEW